jgi:hypothetical protein
MIRFCEASPVKCTFTVKTMYHRHLVKGFSDDELGVMDVVVTRRAPRDGVLIFGLGHLFSFYEGVDPAPIIRSGLKAVDTILEYLRTYTGIVIWQSYSARHLYGNDQGHKCDTDADEVPLSVADIASLLAVLTPTEMEFLDLWHNTVLPRVAAANIPNLLISDITLMSLTRPGAHVGKFNKDNSMDCNHYCENGVTSNL